MEHMKEAWTVEYIPLEDSYYSIRSKGGMLICAVDFGLPGDKTGEKTARAIVDAHNAAIEKEQK